MATTGKLPPGYLLSPLDINDLTSMRRLMHAIYYYLTRAVLHPQAPEIESLTPVEHQIATTITSAIRRNPQYTLLAHAMLSFTVDRKEGDLAVRSAIEDFATLAPENTLIAPATNMAAYREAERKFFGEKEEKFNKFSLDKLELLVSVMLFVSRPCQPLYPK
jgi:hypothetical protein